ncbi:MAG: type IX secretion system PorP/SprF family membrane protein [Cyclobacteriaceae bacterium]|jgi:type IX secretion system PorP/SprF family membrane protein
MRKVAVIILSFVVYGLFGQSATSYQYLFNPLPINPAFTGYHDVFTASVQTRFQSLGVEGAPMSQSLVVHTPIPDQNSAVGLQFWNLSQGVNQQTGLYGSYAYSVQTSSVKISAGLRAGIDFNAVDYTGLLTRQGNDPAFSQSTQLFSPNVGVGIAVSNDRLMAGISAPFLIESDELSLTRRQYLMQLAYEFSISSQLTLQPSVFGRISEEEVEEVIFGMNLNFYEVAGVGLFYNLNQQLATVIYLNASDQLRIAYSAELPLAADQVSRFGSHEIGLHYLFRLPKRNAVSPRYF